MKNVRKVNEVTGIVMPSGTGGHIMLPKEWIGKKVIVTLASVVVIALTFAMSSSTTPSFALTNNETGFTQGYNTGIKQGQIDGHSNVFHAGTVCVGQTVAWCSGYTLGYLDGFLPSSTLNQNKQTMQDVSPSRIIN